MTRLALGVAVFGLCWWIAFRGTPDLERLDMAAGWNGLDLTLWPRAAAEGAVDMTGLTNREREVVELLGRGVRPVEIAQRLCVSHSTVKTHVAHVREKVGAASTLELACQAARAGERVTG